MEAPGFSAAAAAAALEAVLLRGAAADCERRRPLCLRSFGSCFSLLSPLPPSLSSIRMLSRVRTSIFSPGACKVIVAIMDIPLTG